MMKEAKEKQRRQKRMRTETVKIQRAVTLDVVVVTRAITTEI